MPIRLRITLLFTLAVFVILGIVCLSAYYFFASSRELTTKKRLANRAMTTAKLLSQSEIFNAQLVHRIDSLTTLSLKNKLVEAYDQNGKRIYHYSDQPDDSVIIGAKLFENVREKGIVYFNSNAKEAVAFFDITDPRGYIIISAAEDEDGSNTLQGLRQILLISFTGGVCCAFAGGFFFSRKLLQPIIKITNDVNDISAYNIERRIRTGNSRDEWFDLSSTLNNLLDRLKNSFDMQRRFIANASHELSTPLTLIGTQLEITLQRNRNEEEYRAAMHAIMQDVAHMNNLVQTLLKFATASGNPGGLNIDLVRVDEVLMRLPAEIQKQDKAYRIVLHFEQLPEQEEALLVLGNEELLLTAIRNVAANACKYSNDHQAFIGLQPSDKKFIITIEDNGIGMEEKELQNIFQPFYRIENNSTVKGFGLGLSLTYQIIKLHKGSILVTSTPGKGTIFTIELPVASIL